MFCRENSRFFQEMQSIDTQMWIFWFMIQLRLLILTIDPSMSFLVHHLAISRYRRINWNNYIFLSILKIRIQQLFTSFLCWKREYWSRQWVAWQWWCSLPRWGSGRQSPSSCWSWSSVGSWWLSSSPGWWPTSWTHLPEPGNLFWIYRRILCVWFR